MPEPEIWTCKKCGAVLGTLEEYQLNGIVSTELNAGPGVPFTVVDAPILRCKKCGEYFSHRGNIEKLLRLLRLVDPHITRDDLEKPFLREAV